MAASLVAARYRRLEFSALWGQPAQVQPLLPLRIQDGANRAHLL